MGHSRLYQLLVPALCSGSCSSPHVRTGTHAPGTMNSVIPSPHNSPKTSETENKNKPFPNDPFDVRDQSMKIYRVPGVGPDPGEEGTRARDVSGLAGTGD